MLAQHLLHSFLQTTIVLLLLIFLNQQIGSVYNTFRVGKPSNSISIAPVTNIGSYVSFSRLRQIQTLSPPRIIGVVQHGLEVAEGAENKW
jgi:hypothetical protein